MSDSIVAGAGVDVAVRDCGGTGSPILLLHGAANTLGDLMPLARHLTADHRVVAMDFRNHGRSGDGPWHWDAVLDDVGSVIASFELRAPILVGHSLGGIVAALYADRDPSITGAVNLDGHGPLKPEHYDLELDEVLALQARLDELTDAQFDALDQPLDAATMASLEKNILTEGGRWGVDELMATEAFHRRLSHLPDGTATARPDASQARELMAAINELDVFATYRRLTSPLLLFVAERDTAPSSLPPEFVTMNEALRRGRQVQLEALARDRPNVRLVRVDATHGLHYEQPSLIARHLRTFPSPPRGSGAPADTASNPF